MSLCCRPALTTVTLAGRDLTRCTTCGACSAPGDGPAWSERHRGEAVAENSLIEVGR